MGVVIVSDERAVEQLTQARKSAEFFQHNLAKLRQRQEPYVVLRGEEVLARGETPEDAWTEAGKSGSTDNCVLMFVPKQGESCFY